MKRLTTRLLGKMRPAPKEKSPGPTSFDTAAPEPVEHGEIGDAIPWALRLSAAWSWRIIVVIVTVAAALWGVSKLSVITMPLLIALLLVLLLDPLNQALRKYLRMSDTLAAVFSLILGIGIISVLIGVSGKQMVDGFGGLAEKAKAGIGKLFDWMSTGPLKLDATTLQSLFEQFGGEITKVLKQNTGQIASSAGSIASSALSLTSSAANLLAGALIALFCLFFFLKEGRQIWVWCMRLLPVRARETAHEAGLRGWVTLKGYIKAQASVALVDAVFIGLGAAILKVPLAIPLGVLVFIGSFIPIVGAMVTGAVAVLVALMDQGMKAAIIMMVIILLVQQIESNLLQPVLMSNAVSLHPLVVLLSVTAGTFLAGITGALFAVPVVAFINTVVLYITGHDKFPDLATKEDRPGGPPGQLHAMIAASYGQTPISEGETKEAKNKAAGLAQSSPSVDAAESAVEGAGDEGSVRG